MADHRLEIKPEVGWGAGLLEALASLAIFFSPVLLHTHEHALAALLGVWVILRLATRRLPGDLLVVVVVVLVDHGIELALAALGLFTYTHASLGPLPLWLAPFWAGMGLGLRRLFLVAIYK